MRELPWNGNKLYMNIKTFKVGYIFQSGTMYKSLSDIGRGKGRRLIRIKVDDTIDRTTGSNFEYIDYTTVKAKDFFSDWVFVGYWDRG